MSDLVGDLPLPCRGDPVVVSSGGSFPCHSDPAAVLPQHCDRSCCCVSK